MVQSPWNRQGTPQEWKREIISLLKRDDTALCCLCSQLPVTQTIHCLTGSIKKENEMIIGKIKKNGGK